MQKKGKRVRKLNRKLIANLLLTSIDRDLVCYYPMKWNLFSIKLNSLYFCYFFLMEILFDQQLNTKIELKKKKLNYTRLTFKTTHSTRDRRMTESLNIEPILMLPNVNRT